MSESLSSTAIIYAILSLNSEIILQKEYLNSADVDEADIKNEMEVLDDLEQALVEFMDVYKIRCKETPELPNINDLLNDTL